MEIPGLASVVFEIDDDGWLSTRIPVPVLGNVDCQLLVFADGDDFAAIAGPGEVWRHVRLGREVTVQREDHADDQQVYVSVECECGWEPEHGLQIVFRCGREVTKVGPYDGRLTNADAFGSADLDGVVYRWVTRGGTRAN